MAATDPASLAVPVLMCRDVPAAVERYRMLGFAATAYGDGAEYAFLERDGLRLHLQHAPGIDPLTTPVTAYLYVADADALHEEWAATGVPGHHHAPWDAPYGLREGGYVDPDGNQLRYGSPPAAGE